jgi:NAD(P)-dependent dehydrogenase (short-subunit alcohol dehydrogenase family)
LADRSFGRIDALVNCASVEGLLSDFGSYPLADFDRMMAVNVRGSFLGLKHLLPRLLDQGSGAVVNLCSAPESDDEVGIGHPPPAGRPCSGSRVPRRAKPGRRACA